MDWDNLPWLTGGLMSATVVELRYKCMSPLVNLRWFPVWGIDEEFRIKIAVTNYEVVTSSDLFDAVTWEVSSWPMTS